MGAVGAIGAGTWKFMRAEVQDRLCYAVSAAGVYAVMLRRVRLRCFSSVCSNLTRSGAVTLVPCRLAPTLFFHLVQMTGGRRMCAFLVDVASNQA